MFIVFLRFSSNKAQAGQFMDAHQRWVRQGFADGVFLLTGSLHPNLGGGILAYNTARAELQRRINEDPFVVQGVVSAEIHELAPSNADKRLDFLVG